MAITNAKSKGRAMVLGIGDVATLGTAVFTTIGGVRAKAYSGNVEEIDVSDGDDDEWFKGLEGGTRKLSLSVSGLATGNVSFELMWAKWQAGTIWPFQLSGVAGGRAIKGLFLVTSLEENGEHNGAQQFSATLALQDTPVFTNS